VADTAITAVDQDRHPQGPDLSVLKIDVDTKAGRGTPQRARQRTTDARQRAEKIAEGVKGCARKSRTYLVVKRV
jgi:hypothetical protein